MTRRRRLLGGALLLVGCISPAPEPTTYMVEMRDGVALATDVYLPEGAGPFPVILWRTPYDKTGDQWTAVGLTRNGVAVVAQDTRGRFASEGVDGVFTTDGDGALADGYDTMEWIAAQPWSNGKIGTSGESALGITQYMAASAGAPWQVMLDAEFATPNLYSDAFFQGGARRYALTQNWLEEQGSLDFLERVDAHPYLDEFWGSAETRDQYAAVNTPGYHVGGWFDVFSQGTLDAFVGYQHGGGPSARGQQKLVMGPWHHYAAWRAEQGELVFPSNAEAPPHDNAFDVLFNHWLELEHPEIEELPADLPAVQYYVMGDTDDPAAPGNEWRIAEDWPPPAAPVRWYLHEGGGLVEACPPASGGQISYVFDPEDPSPTVCGNNLTIDAGPCDQRAIESRADVVVFETPELQAPMEITGRVHATLFVELDQPDADLMVRMTDVHPDGRSMLISDGALRIATRGSQTELTPLSAGEIVPAVVDLWSTSIIVNAGHKLRVSITSSNWPRFAVNRNNGLPYPQSVDGPAKVVTVTVHHDAEHASFLELPDPTRALDDVTPCP